MKEGKVKVDGTDIMVDMYLGGDYKVDLLKYNIYICIYIYIYILPYSLYLAPLSNKPPFFESKHEISPPLLSNKPPPRSINMCLLYDIYTDLCNDFEFITDQRDNIHC